ncbi:MAG: MarR family winged helix-turn-helix transcriptional regulator [Acidobacteriaceae bacterium]
MRNPARKLNLYLDIKHLYIVMKDSGKNSSDTSGVHLWLVLWKAFRAMEAEAGRSIAGLGLCQSDFGVMEALLHKGPLAVKTLGEKVLLTSGSMTAAIDRLERRGWVVRGDDPGDRRSRIVRLTPDGRKTIQALFRSHERDMERAAEGLTRDERAELVRLLRKLGKGRDQGSGLRRAGISWRV